MGLFTEEQKVEYRPEVLSGAQYLQNLMGQTPTVPKQGVAELTPMQMLIQSQMPSMLGNINQAGQLAQNYYSNVLNAPYSLENDPQAQLLQRQAEIAGGQAITASRRGMESRGMLDSSHTAWNDINAYMGAINPYAQARAGLVSEQAARKERAATGIQQAGGQTLQNVAAVGSIADQQRLLEQARQDALYQQLLMQVMFPYQYQAQLADSLMQMPGGVQVTGGGATDFAQWMSLAQPIVTGGIGAYGQVQSAKQYANALQGGGNAAWGAS